MKNPAQWRPSKYVVKAGRLRPSDDRVELSPSSRLMAWLIVDAYGPALAEHARGALLDLGCGKVPFYEAYRAHVDDNTCVDWPGSPHGALHVDRFCDLALPLPFDDASFDTLLSSDVVEHLPDPALAFGEMGRVLKPGGKLILNTPFLYMLHEMPHDYFRYTRYSLERQAAAAGLEVVRLDELGGLLDVLADLSSKALGRIPLIGAWLALAIQGIAGAFARTAPGRKLRGDSAQRFPLGYFMVARKPLVAAPSVAQGKGIDAS